MAPGCPPEVSKSALANYEPGDRVAKGPIVFECKPWPLSLFCSQVAFVPDLTSKTEAWKQAWQIVGKCDGTLAPTSSPTKYTGTCTYTKVVATTPTLIAVTTPVAPWSASTMYEAGDEVRISAKKFKCKPWPFYLWCRMSVYAPTLLETGLWTEAWTLAGTCP